MSFPLFLRKERGGLQLARFKSSDAKFDLEIQKLEIANTIGAAKAELRSLEKQQALTNRIVEDTRAMLTAEERLFAYGESSVFLVNAREANGIVARLQQIAMQYRRLMAHAELFRILAPVIADAPGGTIAR